MAMAENARRRTHETLQAMFLHHIWARKHLASLLIAPPARELGVDHRVSNRGMANPVLYKAQVRARVEEVRGDRVLEHMEMPLRGRDPRELAIVFHEGIQLPAGNRGAPRGGQPAGVG